MTKSQPHDGNIAELVPSPAASHEQGATENFDPFALGGRNGETATETAPDSAGGGDVATVSMASPAGIGPAELPPTERAMPDTHNITLPRQLPAVDPIPGWLAERERLEQAANATSDEKIGEEAFNAFVDSTARHIAAIDEQIADTVATTPEGLISQVRLLDLFGGDEAFSFSNVHTEDCIDRLVNSISVGIRHLAEASFPAPTFDDSLRHQYQLLRRIVGRLSVIGTGKHSTTFVVTVPKELASELLERLGRIDFGDLGYRDEEPTEEMDAEEQTALLSTAMRQLPMASAAPPSSLAALWAERGRLVDEINGDDPEKDETLAEAMIDRELEIEDEIARQVATDKGDLIAQLHLLRDHHHGYDWGEWGDSLVNKLIAGIAMLGGTDKREDYGARPGETADAQIYALFRRWLEETRAYDNAPDHYDSQSPIADAALARRDAAEDEIIAVSGGGVALAVKAYLLVRAGRCWAKEDATVRLEPGSVLREREDILISLLRNAAAMVPELAEPLAPVIHQDAALIEADMELGWCRDRLSDKDRPPQTPQYLREVEQRLLSARDLIAKIEAKTPRGAAIKTLHRLFQPARVIEVRADGSVLIEQPDGRRGIYRDEPAPVAMAE